jgi:hypothetical protein
MRVDHNPWEEFHQAVVEALQAAYPHLTQCQLTTLLIATGVHQEEAFPWHTDKAASESTSKLAA